jgi:hypothetical protein
VREREREMIEEEEREKEEEEEEEEEKRRSRRRKWEQVKDWSFSTLVWSVPDLRFGTTSTHKIPSSHPTTSRHFHFKETGPTLVSGIYQAGASAPSSPSAINRYQLHLSGRLHTHIHTHTHTPHTWTEPSTYTVTQASCWNIGWNPGNVYIKSSPPIMRVRARNSKATTSTRSTPARRLQSAADFGTQRRTSRILSCVYMCVCVK